MARYKISSVRGENGIGVGIEKISDQFEVLSIWSLFLREISRNAAMRRACDIVCVDSRSQETSVYMHGQFKIGGTRWSNEPNIRVKKLNSKYFEMTTELARDAVRRKTDIYEELGAK